VTGLAGVRLVTHRAIPRRRGRGALPTAINMLFDGKNVGKLVVKISS